MKSLASLFLLAVFATACSPMRLAVSEDLRDNNDAFTVKGRQGILIKQKLSFGDYHTTTVKRSWTRGSSSRTGIGRSGPHPGEWENIISMEYIRKKQTVRFSLTDGVRESDVYCVSRFQAEDLQIGKSPNSILNIAMDIAGIANRSSSLYYVQLFDGQSEAPWQLVLDNQASQASPHKYQGILAKSRDEYYTLVPATKLEHKGKTGNTLLGSVGFELRNPAGRTVAAVSLIDGGMVFLGKTTSDERFLLANACAAILLQQEID